MPSSLKQELHGTTARASAAVFILMALLMGFPLLPAALRWPGRILAFGALVYLAIALIRGLRRVRWSVKGGLWSTAGASVRRHASALPHLHARDGRAR